jgi:glycosyltransferase involved in cell wall biosynthesis
MQSLSVLIPTYNDVCVALVEQLLQLLQAANIQYEVIVADDGSTDEDIIAANRAINQLPSCRFIERQMNVGRAAIRNFLAMEARFSYILFIDSDMTIISDQYIQRYLQVGDTTVIDGGVTICDTNDASNLRYLYEKAEEPHHTATERQKCPYQHLHTANLFMQRDIILAHPFDERFRHYGYEDVLLGKVLHQHHIPIEHIDNPLGFSHFETNPVFVAKTEEGLRTLYQFRNDLRGYSRLLTFVSGIHIPLILSLIRFWHRLFKKAERRNLCGSRPSLWIFKLYRLGYFLCLK